MYLVTHLVGYDLLLTQFRQFWQLMGRYFSYLLPRQDNGTYPNPSQREVVTDQIDHPVFQLGHRFTNAILASFPFSHERHMWFQTKGLKML